MVEPRLARQVMTSQLAIFDAVDPVEAALDWSGPVEVELCDETSVQAACGLMHVHGRATGCPQRLGVDYASTAAGVLASCGVLAASVARARGLRVSAVRTSVAQAALLSIAQYLAAATCAVDEDEPDIDGLRPPFTSADGVRFEIETLNAEDWARFWSGLGAPRPALARGWRPFQHRFGTATCPLPSELHEAAAAADFATVRVIADSAGVSVLPVRDDPSHPKDEPAYRLSPLGQPGQSLPRTDDLPLSGIVVVESARRVQGPVAGLLLSMLGAEVIRVEPPGGDPLRGVPPMAGETSARFLALNRGKRVVEADLTTEHGHQVVCELVRGADVFLHNWAPGKDAKFGLTPVELARVRPGLSYAWASGWGELYGRNPPLGTDFLVQAGSGLAAACTPRGQAPTPTLMTVTDLLGGMVCAQGVVAALLRRVRTGAGSTVHSSLHSAAGTIPRRSYAGDTPSVSPLWMEDEWVAVSPSPEPNSVFAPSAESRSSTFSPASARHRTATASEPRSDAREHGLLVTPVCTDLRMLAADHRFRAALGYDGCSFPLSPWEFV